MKPEPPVFPVPSPEQIRREESGEVGSVSMIGDLRQELFWVKSRRRNADGSYNEAVLSFDLNTANALHLSLHVFLLQVQQKQR